MLGTHHHVRSPWFDAALDAWVVTRYADVLEALRHADVVPEGTPEPSAASGHAPPTMEIGQAFAQRLESVRPEFTRAVAECVRALPRDGRSTVDLRAAVAEPAARELACRLYGMTDQQFATCSPVAGVLFREASTATSGASSTQAQSVALSLATLLGSPYHVQGFVAVSNTLPALLTNVWRGLLEQPLAQGALRERYGALRDNHGVLRARAQGDGDTAQHDAVAELLRVGSPARAVFRTTRAVVRLGDVELPSHVRLVLMLSAANRDPAHFPNPDQLDFSRSDASHLAIGAGAHRCVGASVVRIAVGTVTTQLLAHTSSLTLASLGHAPEWQGGFAICAPASLSVVLER